MGCCLYGINVFECTCVYQCLACTCCFSAVSNIGLYTVAYRYCSKSALQIAGMKLEGDKAPPVQRHSAPLIAASKPEEPVAKHVTAALRQSAPAPKVTLCFVGTLFCMLVQGCIFMGPCATLWKVQVCCELLLTHMHACRLQDLPPPGHLSNKACNRKQSRSQTPPLRDILHLARAKSVSMSSHPQVWTAVKM